MTTGRPTKVTIGAIAVAGLCLGRAMGAAHAAPPPAPFVAESIQQVAAPASVDLSDLSDLLNAPAGSMQLDDPVTEPPRLDVYGNEVQEAVGDYRVDPGGDIYENHSPDIEVAHLGPQTS